MLVPLCSRSGIRLAAAILAMVLVAVSIAAAWWWVGRPVYAGPSVAGAHFASLSFSPYRPGESPLSEVFPTAEEADADMAAISALTGRIRTYSAFEGEWSSAALAQRHGLRVWQGIWLGPDRERNEREIARGIALANAYPDVIDRVVVGNEVLLRGDLPVDELIADIARVKSAVRQKVTYADVWDLWKKYPQVARHVDVVTVHLLPYWEDRPAPIEEAVLKVNLALGEMRAIFRDKPIAIGETGWPSRGRQRDGARPGRVNEARFIRGFIDIANAYGIDYNIIEAFDQDWKYRLEGVVGANWGVTGPTRQPKFPMAGHVSDDPFWALHAAARILLGLLMAVPLLAVHGRMGILGLMSVAAVAMGMGGIFGFALVNTWSEIYDAHLAAAAAVNSAGQGLLACMLIRRLMRIASGAPVPDSPAASAVLARAGAAMLGPWRGRLAGLSGWTIDDIMFLFTLTAAVLTVLLIVDGRYREFPVAAMAVPVAAVIVRLLAGDLPSDGGGAGELQTGLVLTFGTAAMAVMEGSENRQAIEWAAMALILAIPPMRRLGYIDPAYLPRRRDWAAILLIGGAMAAFVAYRHAVIDNRAMDAACRSDAWTLQCLARSAILRMQLFQGLGACALAAGLAAILIPRRGFVLGVVAVLAGSFAAVNYNATWGVAAAALGCLAWGLGTVSVLPETHGKTVEPDTPPTGNLS